jgi:hypothetical protein
LIDGGETHNFIDVAWVSRRQVNTKEFEGFKVAMVDGFNVSCTNKIPILSLTIGNYTIFLCGRCGKIRCSVGSLVASDIGGHYNKLQTYDHEVVHAMRETYYSNRHGE